MEPCRNPRRRRHAGTDAGRCTGQQRTARPRAGDGMRLGIAPLVARAAARKPDSRGLRLPFGRRALDESLLPGSFPGDVGNVRRVVVPGQEAIPNTSCANDHDCLAGAGYRRVVVRQSLRAYRRLHGPAGGYRRPPFGRVRNTRNPERAMVPNRRFHAYVSHLAGWLELPGGPVVDVSEHRMPIPGCSVRDRPAADGALAGRSWSKHAAGSAAAAILPLARSGLSRARVISKPRCARHLWLLCVLFWAPGDHLPYPVLAS